MQTTATASNFKINDSDDDFICGSPRGRQISAESIPSDNVCVRRLIEAVNSNQNDSKKINFYRVLAASIYCVRAVVCWSETSCHYNPLDDLALLTLANLDITWSQDFYNIFDYFTAPRHHARNYKPRAITSAFVLGVRIYGAYELQQQLGNTLVDSKTPPLMAQVIANGVLEAYSMVFVAVNSKLRGIEEAPPTSEPVLLFRQFTGQHDNSSEDDFSNSNPNTPSASPGLY
jgi:hypothetical protein